MSIFLDSLGAASARFACVRYENGDDIVTNGLICDQEPLGEGEYSYSFVPLGFIVSGNITVIKDGKGMKNLGEGDFLGLFETSDWIQTGQKRQIGDWSLVASGEAMVFYFGPSLLTDESEAASEFRTHLVSLAREDHVPQPITTLPLLDWVASHTMKVRPRDCAIIAHTHLLPNNLPLFRHLSSLVDFGRIYVMDKPYSTVRSALNDLVLAGFEVIPVRMEADLPYEFAVSKSLDVLWNKVIDDQKRRQYRKILIIDDGGDVWQSVPWDDLSGVSIAAVEQTQRGIARAERTGKRFPPIVSVASSGIKKNVESEFIGVSVVKKLDDLGILTSSGRVGIIGMGSIGSAVEKSLLERGIDPLFYDPVYHVMPVDSPRRRDSLDVLLEECDLIVGTTGTDALKGLPFERVTTGKKTLASASSADLEFSSLLKLAPHRSEPFETVSIPVHERLTIDILNGGYPINFDRQKDATPDDDIVLTRCLMYVGAMQALELIGGDAPDRAVFNLDPVSQKYLLSRWIDEKNTSGRTPRFSRADVDEIVNASSFVGGKEMKTIWMDQLNG
ncbi:MAG TPA: NAD(P)-dependent oxidoreductase [Candidatus Fimivivens sp.]|nr:NAD(P)-dependent oxidoreductase [Candidatus Fimivivens sp.]